MWVLTMGNTLGLRFEADRELAKLAFNIFQVSGQTVIEIRDNLCMLT